MRKFFNGLRYGSTKTKTFLIGLVLIMVFGLISTVLAVISYSPLWGMSAVFSFLLAVIFSQSLTSKNIDNVKKITIANKEVSSKQMMRNEEDEKEETTKDKVAELPNLSQQQLKKICIKYKVKKEHYPIVIDSWNSKLVYQCPAYVWIHRGNLRVLLFEKEPRRIDVPVGEVATMTYEKGCLASVEKDYTNFQKSGVLKLAFSSYLPTLYEETVGMHHFYKKNLYVLGKDLKLTNTSVKTMLDLLSITLSVQEHIKDSSLHNIYFETAYSYHIMLKDGVLSVNEFKTKIKLLLKKLADAQITNEIFLEYMNQLVSHRLVTREYADYYIEYRTK